MHTHGQSFQGLGIAPKFLEILARNGYTIPTPIQHQCIPVAMEGKDIIGIAQTGTGKTLAFGVPMLQSLLQKDGQGLVVVPTRELAVQVAEMLHQVGHTAGIKTAVVIGGESMDCQARQLRAHPHVLIATPGRLIDHLQQRNVSLANVRILVLDEADRMLDMGFAPQINTILERVPHQRQTMLFSATMPEGIVTVAARHMKLPVRVEVAPPGSAPKDVSQELFFVESQDRIPLLESLLSEYHGSVLVFTRTKFAAKKLARQLRASGQNTIELHSNRSPAQRRDAMEGFKIGRYRVLVATDIAARGIDVSGIELVVNFDLPMNPEDYVHRIGRTGRAGAVGHAISFAMPHQRADVKSIEQVIRRAVRVSPVPAHARTRVRPEAAPPPTDAAGHRQHAAAPSGRWVFRSKKHRIR
ncbi:MAG TPA: DEAD/DEAH box helicase [Acidobacteriota bacterium]|nr:DEAD/DEAH box helicase [Acidobacteriota bacterium]